MFVAVRSALLCRIFLIQPDAKTLPQSGFGHWLQQKVVCTQPEGMERKIQIAAPDNACLGTKRADALLHSIHPPPAGRSRHLSAARSARLQKSFPDRGNSPFGEINNARRRTARSALPKKLPAPCCLSARRFDTQRPSFLLPLLRFSVSSIRADTAVSSCLARKPGFRHEIPFSAATEPGNCAIIRMKEFIKEVGSYSNSFLVQHEICDRR